MNPMEFPSIGADSGWLQCARVQSQLRRLDPILWTSLQSSSDFVSNTTRHLLAASGKRLRPALVLLAAQFGTRQPKRLLRVAAGIELLHLASLYLDDVIDHARQRRGICSANAAYDNQTAVVAGDYLLARATEFITSAGDAVTNALADTVMGMCAGQRMEMHHAYDLAMTEATQLEIIRLKTGALYQFACKTGALLGGVAAADVDRLENYGLQLGALFQVIDDVLDIAADAAQLGKQPGSDLREGVYTLPVIRTLQGCVPGREQLLPLLATPPLADASLTRALALLRGNGSLASSLAMACSLAVEARRNAAGLESGPGRESLERLVDHVLARVEIVAQSTCEVLS